MLYGLARGLNATMSDRSHCRWGTHPTRRADGSHRSGVIDALGARRAGGIPSSPELPGEVWINRPNHAANAARRRRARFVSFLLTHSDWPRARTGVSGPSKILQRRRPGPTVYPGSRASDVPTVPQGLTCLDAHVRTGISPAGSPITLDITSSRCY